MYERKFLHVKITINRIMRTDRFEAIVIGAGIIGTSVAWELSRRGLRVLLIDSAPTPLTGASAASFGSLTPFSDPFFTGDARDFAADSVNLYRSSWLEQLMNCTSIPITMVDKGLIELLETDEDITHASSHAAAIHEAGYRANLLTPEETRLLEPELTGEYAGALWMDEPWLDIEQYFAAIRKAISESQVASAFSCSVDRVEIKESSATVVAAEGHRYEADTVILSTGATNISIPGYPSIPLKSFRGDAIGLHVPDDKPLLQRHIYMKDGFITPRSNGFMLLGATYDDDSSPHDRRFSDRVDLSQFMRLVEVNRRILPRIAECEVGRVWRGWRPSTLDGMPVLGPISEASPVLLATGFIGLGVTMAPAVALSVADYCERRISPFPASFNPMRFHNSTVA